jgi:hypothetical protein
MKIEKPKNVQRQRMCSTINHVGNSALPRKNLGKAIHQQRMNRDKNPLLMIE